MCNGLVALLLAENDGKQADCYCLNLKQNPSFSLKPELLNFATGVNKQIHLSKNIYELFHYCFIYFFIYLMHFEQWKLVFHMLFISLQLTCWHFWLNLWLTQTWTHFLQHGTRKHSFFPPIPFRMTGNFLCHYCNISQHVQSCNINSSF